MIEKGVSETSVLDPRVTLISASPVTSVDGTVQLKYLKAAPTFGATVFHEAPLSNEYSIENDPEVPCASHLISSDSPGTRGSPPPRCGTLAARRAPLGPRTKCQSRAPRHRRLRVS